MFRNTIRICRYPLVCACISHSCCSIGSNTSARLYIPGVGVAKTCVTPTSAHLNSDCCFSRNAERPLAKAYKFGLYQFGSGRITLSQRAGHHLSHNHTGEAKVICCHTITRSAVLPTAVMFITAIKRSCVAAVDTRSVPVVIAGKRKPR